MTKISQTSAYQSGLGWDAIRTERAAKPDVDIARTLLRNERASISIEPRPSDDRPLIDKLHEATFNEPVGLQWIADKYALRMLLRKAHCFTLDDATSSMVADFSIAIAKDLESARQLAIPPFPVTWIDLNNRKRLNRIRELGVPLTRTAAGETEAGPAVERVGWLISPAEYGYFCTYVCAVDQGVLVAPLSYFWSSGNRVALHHNSFAKLYQEGFDVEKESEYMRALCFGVETSNVHSADAHPAFTPLHSDWDARPFKGTQQYVRDLMQEIAGELRHVWGFLIALGAGQLGVESATTQQSLHNDIRKMPNGKPLLPLEHKILHLHLRKRTTPDKVVARMITQHKLRWHEVRAHWRELRNADGSLKKRVPIKAHERGDERLGKITKTYKVET